MNAGKEVLPGVDRFVVATQEGAVRKQDMVEAGDGKVQSLGAGATWKASGEMMSIKCVEYLTRLFTNLEVTPWHIVLLFEIGTMKALRPRSSPQTTRRATTMPTRSKPSTRPVGGMNLKEPPSMTRREKGSRRKGAHLAASSEGVCKSYSPEGRSVAVVSR